MKLILDIESVDGSQQRVWMSPNELVRIGRSSHADVCIESDSALADIHFAIEGRQDGWNLQVARGVRVGVNGLPEQQCRLNHGDLILAGQTEFRISIAGSTQSANVDAALPIAYSSPVPHTCATYRETISRSGVVQLAVTLNDTPLIHLLRMVCDQSSLWVTVNEQRLGGSIQRVEKQTEDLFAQAPEEIRATDSLIVGRFELDEAILKDIQSASRADAAVLFVSPLPLPQILHEQKIVWAWYSRPSILKQQLTLGSKELAKKLLATVESIVILDGVGCDVSILVRPDVHAGLAMRLASLSPLFQ